MVMQAHVGASARYLSHLVMLPNRNQCLKPIYDDGAANKMRDRVSTDVMKQFKDVYEYKFTLQIML